MIMSLANYRRIGGHRWKLIAIMKKTNGYADIEGAKRYAKMHREHGEVIRREKNIVYKRV